MTTYRVIFQDTGADTRRADTTYTRVRVWEGQRYIGAWFGLLNGRSRLRHLGDAEQARHYEAMAPVALALAVKDAVVRGEFGVPRDIALHPTTVLRLQFEPREWTEGDEILSFDV